MLSASVIHLKKKWTKIFELKIQFQKKRTSMNIKNFFLIPIWQRNLRTRSVSVPCQPKMVDKIPTTPLFLTCFHVFYSLPSLLYSLCLLFFFFFSILLAVRAAMWLLTCHTATRSMHVLVYVLRVYMHIYIRARILHQYGFRIRTASNKILILDQAEWLKTSRIRHYYFKNLYIKK